MTNEVRELFDFVASGGRSVLYDYGSSRTASVQDDVRITEVVDGLIVTRPAKKITYIDETKEKESESESEPEIIELGCKSKAASTPAAVNPVREIFEFLNGKLE